MSLGRDGILEPKLTRSLDAASAGLHNDLLATEESWQVPSGWTARQTTPGEYRVGIDHRVVHQGKSSIFLRSLVAEPAGRVSIRQRFSADSYRGKRVRLRGYLRSEKIVSHAALLLRVTAGDQSARAS